MSATYTKADLKRAYSNWGDTPSHLAQLIADVRAEERERCERWALEMRRGTLDDIRSVIAGIESGQPFEADE